MSQTEIVSLPVPSRPPRRRRSSSSSSSSSTLSQPTITDADDSIVLSDLVRTGEASRLRRRGAMRLDRNSVHVHPPALSRRPGIFIEDSDSEDEHRPSGSPSHETLDRRHRAFASHQHQYPSYSRWVEDQETDDDSVSYVLVCGAEVDAVPPKSADLKPFEPSILPVLPNQPSTSTASGSGRTTNGCGSIIHFYASCSASQHSTKAYTAKSQATDIVIPLGAEYFSPYIGMKFETSSCGCVKEGIGCSVCGNPLGTRWKFCPRMAEGRKPPSRRRRGPRGPEGPRYWGGSPSPSRRYSSDPPCPPGQLEPEPEPQPELYTFFANAVTAYADPTPTHDKPSTPPPPAETSSPISSPRFAPSSPQRRRTVWLPDDPISDSDSEHEIEFARIDPASREARIQFGGPTFVNFPEAQPRPDLTLSIAPPLFDRQYTTSPEPFAISELPEDSRPTPLDPDGNEAPFEALMSALRNDTPGTVDSPSSSLPRGVHPAPQPMSFYEQQVLGAWERERDLERQVHQNRDAEQLPSPTPWYQPGEIQLSRTVVVRQPVDAAPWRTTEEDSPVVWEDLNSTRLEDIGGASSTASVPLFFDR